LRFRCFGGSNEEEIMDKLAKRAGVGMLIVIAATGSAFALGLVRSASSLDTDRAVLKLSKAPLPAIRAVAPPRPLDEPVPLAALKPDLPSAFAKALGATPKAPAPRPRAAVAVKPALMEEREPASPPADDMLNLDFGADEREAKLADRGPKAFGVHQLGGAEEQRKERSGGVRVTFETDLARPEPH
jgi:hypothetical protein